MFHFLISNSRRRHCLNSYPQASHLHHRPTCMELNKRGLLHIALHMPQSTVTRAFFPHYPPHKPLLLEIGCLLLETTLSFGLKHSFLVKQGSHPCFSTVLARGTQDLCRLNVRSTKEHKMGRRQGETRASLNIAQTGFWRSS